jgi:hypothetical protein
VRSARAARSVASISRSGFPDCRCRCADDVGDFGVCLRSA